MICRQMRPMQRLHIVLLNTDAIAIPHRQRDLRIAVSLSSLREQVVEVWFVIGESRATNRGQTEHENCEQKLHQIVPIVRRYRSGHFQCALQSAINVRSQSNNRGIFSPLTIRHPANQSWSHERLKPRRIVGARQAMRVVRFEFLSAHLISSPCKTAWLW